MSNSARAKQQLRREAECAKRALSSQHQVRVEIESISEGVDLSETLTRARFEELNDDLFKRTLTPVSKALADAKVDKSEIDDVVLVGGSTRIPKVRAMLKAYFNGREPSKGVNPDEAVAIGAAVQVRQCTITLFCEKPACCAMFDPSSTSLSVLAPCFKVTQLASSCAHCPALVRTVLLHYRNVLQGVCGAEQCSAADAHATAAADPGWA